MQQWGMKQGRLIVHTRSYNATMGNEARKTHCSHKELQCKQWVMNQGRLIAHTRSYKCKQWVMKQGRLFVHTTSYNANNG
ncbi:hypothetical protein KSS87_005592 [Heliosperma pusillum]|nr:hypothetical protein KSS87_010534 [Heliosperma pusillum]KAH9615370.1 hypothetical protein KSS87_005592 [Heliosperma pusillum]